MTRNVWLALLLLTSLAAGQADPADELVTDRPDFTESTNVVGHGVAQLEMGTLVASEAGERSLLLGTPLLRIGLSKRWELRLASAGGVWQPAGSGTADLEIGLKWRLWGEGRRRPALALLPTLSLPTGSRAISNRQVLPGLKVAWAKSAGLGFSFSGNLNIARLRGDERNVWQKAVTLSIGHDLGKGFVGFWEVYVLTPFSDADAAPGWMYDMGVTRLAGANAQWDVTWGRRLSPVGRGPDAFLQVGHSIRWHFLRNRRR
jgi:hypothetical protein